MLRIRDEGLESIRVYKVSSASIAAFGSELSPVHFRGVWLAASSSLGTCCAQAAAASAFVPARLAEGTSQPKISQNSRACKNYHCSAALGAVTMCAACNNNRTEQKI